VTAPVRVRRDPAVLPRRIPVVAQRALLARVWERLLAPDDPPADDDTAVPSRLPVGAMPTTHNDRVSACQQDDAVAVGDDRHEPSTVS